MKPITPKKPVGPWVDAGGGEMVASNDGPFLVSGCWTKNRGENSQKGWLAIIMENPIKMDDLGGFPIFLEPPIYSLNFWGVFFWSIPKMEVFPCYSLASYQNSHEVSRWLVDVKIHAINTRWFKVTSLSPSWRSLNLGKGYLTIPKRSQRLARYLGGVFRYFLFSPRSLGFHDPIWLAYIFFRLVGEKPPARYTSCIFQVLHEEMGRKPHLSGNDAKLDFRFQGKTSVVWFRILD